MGRHGEVCSLLKGLKASRGKATRVYQRDAIAINSRRRGEVKALLTQFGREMVARRKHRQELSMAQLEKAAGFMRDLTSGVAALRDRFVKDDRDRAAAIHGRLAAYALDRREAVAIWRGSPRRGQQAGAQTTEASHRPAAEPAAVHAESPGPAGAPAGTPAHTADATARSSPPPFGNLGQLGSKGRHGGHSK
jgi:hypothetical protein